MPKQSLIFEFIADFFDETEIAFKPMFGHQCVYYKGKMVMYLIDKPDSSDNGVCLATLAEHIPTLSKKISSLRHLESYGRDATNWRLIPADSDSFEEDVETACKLIKAGSPLIGREPKSKRKISAATIKRKVKRS